MKISRPLADRVQDALFIALGSLELDPPRIVLARTVLKELSQLIADQTVKTVECDAPKKSEDR